MGNHALRLVAMPSQQVTTVAGGSGCGLRDGVASSAQFCSNSGTVVDPYFNVWTADYNYGLLRKTFTRNQFPACDNKWHHIALTHGDPYMSSTWWQVYVDGVPGTPVSMAGGTPAASSLFVGWNGKKNAASCRISHPDLAKI